MLLFKSFHRLVCGNPVNELFRCLEILWLDLDLFTGNRVDLSPHLKGEGSKRACEVYRPSVLEALPVPQLIRYWSFFIPLCGGAYLLFIKKKRKE